MGVLTLALFYGVASLKYFGHTHVFLQYAWMLMVPTILLYDLAGQRAQIFILVSLLPGWLSLGYLLHHPPTGAQVAGAGCQQGCPFLPGWTILPLLSSARTLVSATLGKAAIPDLRIPSLIVPVGAGPAYYYRVPHFSRHLWYIPQYVRPYDTPELIRKLDQAAAVIVWGEPSGDALHWAEPCLLHRWYPNFGKGWSHPSRCLPVCRVFFVRPVASP